MKYCPNTELIALSSRYHPGLLLVACSRGSGELHLNILRVTLEAGSAPPTTNH